MHTSKFYLEITPQLIKWVFDVQESWVLILLIFDKPGAARKKKPPKLVAAFQNKKKREL
jgi:hypothetical protein